MLDQQHVELKYLEFKYYMYFKKSIKKNNLILEVFIIKYDNNNLDDKFMSSIISKIYLYITIFFIKLPFSSRSYLDFITVDFCKLQLLFQM